MHFNKSKGANEKGWKYNTDSTITKQEGSGNNWANGFLNHGPSIENKIVDKINKIAENYDYIDGIILINSLAGGTGSGLGSYSNIVVKDYFPVINLMNVSIWPHDTGEVIVNSYNTVLSISESYKVTLHYSLISLIHVNHMKVSDCMMLIRNQEIYDICKEIHKMEKISFDSLNHIISKSIISATLPVINSSNKTINDFWKKSTPIETIIDNLVEDPRFKFIRNVSLPEV